MTNIKIFKFIIVFALGISIGIFGGKAFSFFYPNIAIIMVVEMDECKINHAELKVHDQTILVEANSSYGTLDIQFFGSNGYSYQYELILHTEKCGEISSGVRIIDDGHIFYERMYKDRIEHEIRA